MPEPIATPRTTSISTRSAVELGLVVAIVVTLVGALGAAVAFGIGFESIKRDISDNRRATEDARAELLREIQGVRDMASDRWTFEQQERFRDELKMMNDGIHVPEISRQ